MGYGAIRENHKTHTSTGRKFALVEGLNHDLESMPDRLIIHILYGN